MTNSLLADDWTTLDSIELRMLLGEHIQGPGQYDGKSRTKLYLPRADESGRIVLTYKGHRISKVEAGPAFDAAEWDRIHDEIERSILKGPTKIGRELSFSSFRVHGFWRGARSGIQILPPPADAPSAPVEMAEHPFILEFPISACERWAITNHRRIREHRRLTLVLNVLLNGRMNIQPQRSEHFWADVRNEGESDIRWVQRFYFAKFGKAVIDQLSPAVGDSLEEIQPDEYYESIGHDGLGLRVPIDLDEAICTYLELSSSNLGKFNRATFWMDMASRQWNTSMSSSFASLVSAVEALCVRGTTHRIYCDECNGFSQHEVPGATETFRAFFERYAPGVSLRSRRTEMYRLRSDILHGTELMQLDQDIALGWDPPFWNERELHDELWGLTRVALRNWLGSPPAD